MKKLTDLALAKRRDAELKLKAKEINQAKKDAAEHKSAEAKLKAQQAKIEALLKQKKE